jgi:hypothetical protein
MQESIIIPRRVRTGKGDAMGQVRSAGADALKTGSAGQEAEASGGGGEAYVINFSTGELKRILRLAPGGTSPGIRPL